MRIYGGGFHDENCMNAEGTTHQGSEINMEDVTHHISNWTTQKMDLTRKAGTRIGKHVGGGLGAWVTEKADVKRSLHLKRPYILQRNA